MRISWSVYLVDAAAVQDEPRLSALRVQGEAVERPAAPLHLPLYAPAPGQVGDPGVKRRSASFDAAIPKYRREMWLVLRMVRGDKESHYYLQMAWAVSRISVFTPETTEVMFPVVTNKLMSTSTL
mgnify:CR=1 FL=1